MFKSKKILALIPARAGSKGIKNKNIVDFAGKPLIYWTIQASCHSQYIDHTVVSTDGEEIAMIAQEAGADVPFLRPAEFADDKATLEAPLHHCIDWFERQNSMIYDYLILLQPTSPLRTSRHIDEAIQFYFENKKTNDDTLVSVTLAPRKVGWLMQKKDSVYIDFCFDISNVKRLRQEMSDYYLPNGAIYFGPIGILKKQGFYTPQVLPFLMKDTVSIDIDSPKDLEEALKIFNTTSFQGEWQNYEVKR